MNPVLRQPASRQPAPRQPAPRQGAPRILLVEDDPVSLAFLAAVLEALPARVDAADCSAQALAMARDAPGHALWLIDANLPDGSGAELLASLRTLSSGTPSSGTPSCGRLPPDAAAPAVALAHTASRLREVHAALLAAGFAEVLVKPLAAQALQDAVRQALGMHAGSSVAGPPHCVKLPNWDDAAARLALNGHDAHVASLRQLFLDELPSQRQAIAAALASGDGGLAAQVLHRMRASCGFVGAARLGAAVAALEHAPGSAQALARFQDAVSDLLLPA